MDQTKRTPAPPPDTTVHTPQDTATAKDSSPTPGERAANSDTGTREGGRITRDAVLTAAMRLVRESGVEALSMRKLAAELGVAVTSIYWHVGNRDALVDQLVQRVISDMEAVDATGATPGERITSIACTARRLILERPHLIGLVRERGLDSLMMLPARRALVAELATAGVHGARAAYAVHAVQTQVVAFVIMERTLAGATPPSEPVTAAWQRRVAEGDPALAAALAAPVDYEALFDSTLRALVDALLR